MPDILIRGLDTKTINRLKARARRSGRSLQGEARRVLENAAGLTITEALTAARQCRRRLGRRFDDSAALIREDRER